MENNFWSFLDMLDIFYFNFLYSVPDTDAKDVNINMENCISYESKNSIMLGQKRKQERDEQCMWIYALGSE